MRLVGVGTTGSGRRDGPDRDGPDRIGMARWDRNGGCGQTAWVRGEAAHLGPCDDWHRTQ